MNILIKNLKLLEMEFKIKCICEFKVLN